ncbi:MAG: SDR family oxidoreductase [Phycisphaerae bacterium]|nr:SDR family oxidoreductase [Phycisphaerae bacterium]
MARIDLRGLPIAITGASSGIGYAAAIACARAGMPVAVSARRADRLNDLVTLIMREGGRAVAVPGDVASPEDCARLVDATREAFGSVYAVFANAGYGIEKPVHETTDQELRDLVETNFWGSMNLVRAALPHMLESKRGHLLWCSSCVSKLGIPRMAAYSSSKAMQDHFARAMRVELAGSGIYSSSVHPIGTISEFSDSLKSRSGLTKRAFGRPDKGLFVQTSEHVARAIVACLRKPRGEVWTSPTMHMLFALGVAMPGLADAVLMRRARKRDRQR